VIPIIGEINDTNITSFKMFFFLAGRGESQQPGSHTSHQQQVGRGRTVVQERTSIAAGRRDHVGQSPETQKRPTPSAHGQMINRSVKLYRFIMHTREDTVAIPWLSAWSSKPISYNIILYYKNISYSFRIL